MRKAEQKLNGRKKIKYNDDIEKKPKVSGCLIMICTQRRFDHETNKATGSNFDQR